MQSRRLVFSLLILGMGALLAACTTPTDGLLGSQGFGHFNAKSVNIDLGDGTSGLRTQLIGTNLNALPIEVDGIAQGIGSDIYTLRMSADGIATFVCTNGGMNIAPGQEGDFSTDDQGNIDFTSGRKGKFPFDVDNSGSLSDEAVATFISLYLETNPFPCPNTKNWDLNIDWIDWRHLELFLFDPADVNQENPTDQLHYRCTTDRAAGTIACDLIPDDHPPVEPTE